MFDKVSQRAEEFATQLPRRAFFGRVARAAMPLAVAIGGLWAIQSQAAEAAGGRLCCTSDGSPACKKRGKPCPVGLTPCNPPGGPGEGIQWPPCP
jgi:hypothetical protein